jgi:hypothetical protein
MLPQGVGHLNQCKKPQTAQWDSLLPYLWCHVVERPRTSNSTLLAQINGEPEVRQLEAGTVVGKQDVLGLDVAVDDGASVQVLWAARAVTNTT